jgi:hypothetical protein
MSPFFIHMSEESLSTTVKTSQSLSRTMLCSKGGETSGDCDAYPYPTLSRMSMPTPSLLTVHHPRKRFTTSTNYHLPGMLLRSTTLHWDFRRRQLCWMQSNVGSLPLFPTSHQKMSTNTFRSLLKHRKATCVKGDTATRCQAQRCVRTRFRRHKEIDVYGPNWPIPNHFKKGQSVHDGSCRAGW